MSDIPDDIIAKARGVALDVFANGSDSLDAPVAAEIIARALCEWTGSGQGVDDMLAEISASQSDAILSSLAAEAKRILAPDELDAKTIEACAKVAQKHLDPSSFALAGPASVITQTVARIRALAKQEAKE